MWRRARAAAGTEAGDRAEAIVAEISAQEVGGQIAVGSHNLQINADHGAIVHVARPGQEPTVHERPLPVALQPRDFPELLGRERELAEARTALTEGATVGLTAPPGGGKTSLLRRLSHLAEATLEHGVVFLRAAGWPREDVERFLFDAFYESDAPLQPTPFELRRRLADRRALVVLDDVEQGRDDVCELLDCAPACRFLLASEQRALWGEERTLELGGLGDEAALELLERELGRALRDDERPRAADLCRRLGGRPLAILQAAALARAGELPLGAPGEPEAAVRERLDAGERRVLRALELLAPAAVHVDDVAAIAGVPDAAAVLERLRERGAAQAHSPRWSVTLTLGWTGGGEDGEGALLLRRARERMATAAEKRPVEDVPVILAALGAGDGGSADRRDALALARAVDELLTRGGRWGAWAVALKRALAAAEAGGDRAAAAWALHQLGTRAGCLGDPGGVASLRRALALRRELGDEAGAAVSAHNLSLLFGALPGGGGHHGGQPPVGPSRTGLWLALGGGVLALGVVAALLLSSSQPAKPVAAADSRTQKPVTTVPPTTVVPTPTPPAPRPAGAPGLSITGKLEYAAPDAGTTDSGTVTVTDLGPGPISIAASVDNAAFVLTPRCSAPLEVGQGCVIAITYRAGRGPVSATLRFAGSPSTARLDGMLRATSSRDGEPPPVAVPQGVTTQTTTTPSPAPSESEGVIVR